MKYIGKFEENIFINYPLDSTYESIFRAIVFAILAHGFYPLCAKQEIGGTSRIEKICKMIKKCKYSINDISMVCPDDNNHLPRFNMAFELGLFIGCQRLGTKKNSTKDFLVLDKSPHQTKCTLTDIDFMDSVGYNNDKHEALKAVNNWLRQLKGVDKPGNAWIVNRFKKFEETFPELCNRLGVNIEDPIPKDLYRIIGKFLKEEQSFIKRIGESNDL